MQSVEGSLLAAKSHKTDIPVLSIKLCETLNIRKIFSHQLKHLEVMHGGMRHDYNNKQIAWVPPMTGKFKLGWAVMVSGIAACKGTVWDHYGEVIRSYSFKLGRCSIIPSVL